MALTPFRPLDWAGSVAALVLVAAGALVQEPFLVIAGLFTFTMLALLMLWRA